MIPILRVNFFGHAVAACWQDSAPGFVLGAMLPDFASMCGATLVQVNNSEIAAGVAWHHKTDRWFHELAGFCQWTNRLALEMRERGLARGPSRGAAHVGVELLLDDWLAGDPAAHSAYSAAIAAGAPSQLGAAIQWPSTEQANRWHRLRDRLAARGAPKTCEDPHQIVLRIYRALATRPRLALAQRDLGVVASLLKSAHPEFAREVPRMLATLRHQLCGSSRA